MLVINDYESHHTSEFLFYCENHKIIFFSLSLHTTYLLQSLNVYVFQSLKHWHSKMINRAVQMNDEIFSKVELLTAFNEFWIKVFKEFIIQSAWKHTDLISFDLKIVLNKVWIIEHSNWFITSSFIINDSVIWITFIRLIVELSFDINLLIQLEYSISTFWFDLILTLNQYSIQVLDLTRQAIEYDVKRAKYRNLSDFSSLHYLFALSFW